MSQHKIGLLGMGEVNSTVAYGLMNQPHISEIKIYSRNLQKTASIAYDLQDASVQFSHGPLITNVEGINGLLDTDIIVIGIRDKFKNKLGTGSRINGLDYNFQALIPYLPQLSGYKGHILVITNPVDIICHLLHSFLRLDGTTIYGIGSNLDTSRYKSVLSHHFNASPEDIECEVIGEHGELMLPLFSNTLIKGQILSLNREEILSRIQHRPTDINKENIRVKYGVSAAVISTIHQLLGEQDGHNQLSCFYDGIYLGMPVDFTEGVGLIKLPKMDSWEKERFTNCRYKLKSMYTQYLHQTTISIK